MPLANMIARRKRLPGQRGSQSARPPGGSADPQPGRLGDLRGPARGVILLPRHLAWPGLRECDVSDDHSRRCIYAMLLAHGTNSEIIRLVNAELLRDDWPLISRTVEPGPRLRWQAVLEPEPDDVGDTAPASGSAPAGGPAPASGPASGSAPEANPVALT